MHIKWRIMLKKIALPHSRPYSIIIKIHHVGYTVTVGYAVTVTPNFYFFECGEVCHMLI